MGYDDTGSKPSLEEAIPLAIQSLLQAKTTALNNHLSRDVYSSFLSIQPSNILIGNLDNSWDETTGLVQVCIVPGDYRNGVYYQMGERFYIDGYDGGSNFKTSYRTTIYAYIHPNAWTNFNPIFQAQSKAECQNRIMGWLRGGVFNRYSNTDIALASYDYNDPSTVVSDHLTMCYVEHGCVG